MRHAGIKRASNRKTRLKAKLRANASPEDAVAVRTRFFRPRSQFFWSWRPFSHICARLQTIWAKPPELWDYSGRLRRLTAHRFRTVEFGRVSVLNPSFENFPRNLRSVSRNAHGWIPRELLFTFPRVIPSNVISALSYLRFCDFCFNFLGSGVIVSSEAVGYLLANSCAAFSAGDLVIENSALSCLLFSEDFSEGTSDANSF